MQVRRFIFELLFITALAAGAVLIFNQWAVFAASASFSWLSILLFLTLTLLVYILGYQAIKRDNINALSQLILGLVLVKLVACLMLIFLYKKVADPSDHLFAVPFLVIYLIYTVYEVVLLSRQNRASTIIASKA